MTIRREVTPEKSEMEAVIEAILFVANDPVAPEKLLEVFGESSRDAASAALEAVLERYSSHEGGILIDNAGGGLRLVSRPDLHGYLRRFFEVTGTNKLSMPALETLAIVAYRQPVTSPEISELRGVSSQGVLKNLLERRLVRISGRKEVVGKPFLYATTREFLMHFGLRTLDELPPLEQFEEMFSGDTEASADTPPDFEEEAQRESVAVAEADEEVADREEAEAEAEAAEPSAAIYVEEEAEEAEESEDLALHDETGDDGKPRAVDEKSEAAHDDETSSDVIESEATEEDTQEIDHGG